MSSLTDAAPLITSVATLLASIATLIVAIRSIHKVQDVHLMLNSQLDNFKKLIATSSFAEGVKSETDKK